jgi:solute carrier family 8 (sodium/calcium exchanger)
MFLYYMCTCIIDIRVETINGTALATEDYIPFNETVKFAANELLCSIHIEIVDDFEWEPEEFFFVKLSFDEDADDTALGNLAICQVTIINDDGKSMAWQAMYA